MRVVRLLGKAQFEAYFVGGVVRDLLSGEEPKDFDVATDARPRQVCRVFGRASRIIGRRFRLALIIYNRKTIEVATFRSETKNPLITGGAIKENTYGSLEEDMERRDFTVNSMYYNPFTDKLICHEKAISDLEAKRLRTIGNATERFTEDPVRMLRAVRFVSRLNLQMAASEVSAIQRLAKNLHSVPSHRLWMECEKLFLSGSGLVAFKVLKDFGLFGVLFPQTNKLLTKGQKSRQYNDFMQKLLADTDNRVKEGDRASLHFVFLGFLWLELKHQFGQARKLPPEALPPAIRVLLTGQGEFVLIPKQVALVIASTCQLAWLMESQHESSERTLQIEHLSSRPSQVRVARNLLSLSELTGVST